MGLKLTFESHYILCLDRENVPDDVEIVEYSGKYISIMALVLIFALVPLSKAPTNVLCLFIPILISENHCIILLK